MTIARVRRAMPRNVDVMAICEACEALQTAARTAMDSVALASSPKFLIERKSAETKPVAKSRAAYMRDYRKKERALIRKAREQ